MCHIHQRRLTAAETFRMPRSCWENSPSQMPILRHMTDSELENLALRCSAEVLQRLRPCRDSVPQEKKTKKNCRTGLVRPVLPSLHGVLIGKHRCAKEAAAPTWSVGGCPEARGHRRVHPWQRSVFRTSASHAFTRSGGARTFSQGGGGGGAE